MHRISKLEYELEPDDILYFLHIPKTAGTSLTNIIENPFDFESIYPEVIWVELFKKIPKNLSNYKLIRGHFGFWIQKLLSKTPIIVTMLRNPVNHTLSLYSHQLRSFASGVINVLERGDETLDEIFQDPEKSRIFTNHQTRHLNLDLDVLSLIQSLKESGENGRTIRQLYKPKLNTNSEKELLRTAKNRLSKFAFFGLAEKFEESLFLLCYTFGWFPPRIVPKLNISSKRKKLDDLPKETAKKVIAATRLDEKLYRFGEQVFDERFKNMVEDLKEKYYEPKFADLSFREMMYEMLEKHYFHRNQNMKIQPTSSIEYSFGQKMLGSGWYRRERLGNDDTIFRWSGPENESEVYFPLEKSHDLKILVTVVSSMRNDISESLKLKVNDFPVELTIEEKNHLLHDKKMVYGGIIPKEALQNEKILSRFTFFVKDTITPMSINSESTDERKLGLAFSKIKVSPN